MAAAAAASMAVVQEFVTAVVLVDLAILHRVQQTSYIHKAQMKGMVKLLLVFFVIR